MKFIRSTGSRLFFQLNRYEKHLLLEILKLYPLVPSGYQELSRKGELPDQAENQRLLDEALEEQRAENQARAQAFMARPRRLKERAAGWNLSLSGPELEWLLQVLNDIYVGSWISLGSPEDRYGEVNEQTAPQVVIMEAAEFFQMHLLQGFGKAR